LKKLAHAAPGIRPSLREHRSDQSLGGIGRLFLLQPVEQLAQGLKLFASRGIGCKRLIERQLLLGRGLAIEHRMHRLSKVTTIH
jgi:hypothetical protein